MPLREPFPPLHIFPQSMMNRNMEHEWHNLWAHQRRVNYTIKSQFGLCQLFLMRISSFVSVRGPNSEASVKPPVDSLPNYLDSQRTASISFGKISVFSFWPSQQSCLHCRPTSSLFSLTNLAKALWAWEGCSAGKPGERERSVVIWAQRQRNADDEVGSLFVWVSSAELLLMLFGQDSRYKPVPWSLKHSFHSHSRW